MTQKHTPTPYKWTGKPIDKRLKICLASDDRSRPFAWVVSDDVPAEEAIANAAFIVRACNAHDDLVAALEAIDKSWHDTFPDGPEWRDPRGIISIGEETVILWRGIKSALAIAKAGA
jgi:hypothetical protein